MIARIKYLFIGLSVCYFIPAQAKDAASPPAAASNQKQASDVPVPINIHSDRLIVHQKERQAEFLGHVVTDQDNLLIRCEKLVLTYASNNEPDL